MFNKVVKDDPDKPAVRQFLLYLSHRFGIDYEQAMPDEEEWRFIRNKLQKLTAMNDLEQALRRYRRALEKQIERDREQRQWEEDYRKTKSNPGEPHIICGGIELPAGAMRNGDPDLPHGWLTVLEAAYEHFNDQEGLLNLNTLYYIIECDVPSVLNSTDQLEKARKLCGDRWKEHCELMIHLISDYYPELLDEDVPYASDLIWECKLRKIPVPAAKHEKKPEFLNNEWTAKEWLHRTIIGIRNRMS